MAEAATPDADFKSVLHHANGAAIRLVQRIGALREDEREPVARAFLRAMLPILEDTTTKANFDPNQPRNPDGTWADTALGSASMIAHVGGWLIDRVIDAVSTVSLVPSSQTVVSEALNNWWQDFGQLSDFARHSQAVVEGGGRLFITVFGGAAAYAIAQAYVPVAAVLIGAALVKAADKILTQLRSARGAQSRPKERAGTGRRG